MTAPTPKNKLRWHFAALVVLSAVLHAVGAFVVVPWLTPAPAEWDPPVSVRMIDGDPLDALSPEQIARLDALEREILKEEEAPPEEEPEEPEPELPDGQIVETPKPDEEKVPLKSDYLAEHDNAVPEETRTESYRVNPEVLSNQYSRESKMKFEDLADVGATEMSTGATVGSLSDPAAPGKGPPRSLIPSAFAITNKEGLAAPTRASSKDQDLAGAPQNDLLNEKLGASVALNTREFLGAEYMNRIRRAVNFYWKQSLDNLPPSIHVSKPSYTTEVAIVLDGDGALETISITGESGIAALDEGVVQAFRMAGPFPNPPEQLIRKDGRIYIPDFDFTVQFGQAQMQYQGIDPRAGVQFPGIMKSPR